jgi:IS30 family transposase
MGRTYSHLSLEDRRRIAKWREAKMPIVEIADRLGRDASTVYQDLRRNHYDDKEPPELNGYYALNAQEVYERRRAEPRDNLSFCLFVNFHPEVTRVAA